MSPIESEFVETARAKVNLTLTVLGCRSDGYHEIESLVAFAGLADRVDFTRGPAFELDVRGPYARAAGTGSDNLILKAAHALVQRVEGLTRGRFVLFKRLPVAAGIGGGSADAAAALRLLARANNIPLNDPRLFETARIVGADVPVCLDPRPRIMRGIGEILSDPCGIPELPAVLVNPKVAVATKDVFSALDIDRLAAMRSAPGVGFDSATRLKTLSWEALLKDLDAARNDLEVPAIALQPIIAEVLAALAAQSDVRVVRMSGSGATCFALFPSQPAAALAARRLRAEHQDWWIRATVLG